MTINDNTLAIEVHDAQIAEALPAVLPPVRRPPFDIAPLAHWVNERHAIYLRKCFLEGKTPPPLYAPVWPLKEERVRLGRLHRWASHDRPSPHPVPQRIARPGVLRCARPGIDAG